eukprot:8028622-Alexandrium_andersonii.AAC.1
MDGEFHCAPPVNSSSTQGVEIPPCVPADRPRRQSLRLDRARPGGPSCTNQTRHPGQRPVYVLVPVRTTAVLPRAQTDSANKWQAHPTRLNRT